MDKTIILYIVTLINLLIQNSGVVDYYDAQGRYRIGMARSPFSENALSESLCDQTEEESFDPSSAYVSFFPAAKRE